MNDSKEFDLKSEILSFTKQLNENGIITESEQDELLDYFHSEIESLIEIGYDEKEAFEICKQNFGSLALIKSEYEKEKPHIAIREYIFIGIAFFFIIEIFRNLAFTLSNFIVVYPNNIFDLIFHIDYTYFNGFTFEMYAHYLPLVCISIGICFGLFWYSKEYLLTNKKLVNYSPTIAILIHGILWVVQHQIIKQANLELEIAHATGIVAEATDVIFISVIFVLGAIFMFKHRNNSSYSIYNQSNLALSRLLIGFTFYFSIHLLIYAVSISEALLIMFSKWMFAYSEIPIPVMVILFGLVTPVIAFVAFLKFKSKAVWVYQYSFMLPIICFALFWTSKLMPYMLANVFDFSSNFFMMRILSAQGSIWLAVFVYSIYLIYSNKKSDGILIST